MKKVLLITILDNYNIGTYLQAFASVKAIEQNSKGCKVALLQYEREREGLFQSGWLRYKNKNVIIRIALSFIYGIYNFYLRNRFLSFLKRYNIQLTKKVHGFDQVKKIRPEADIFVTGSDQVWNMDYNGGIDETFLLTFVPKEKKKLSFAASIGKEEISCEQKKQLYEALLKYDVLSVRECSAQSLLNQMGLKNVEWLLDPTLIFDKQMWISYVYNKSIESSLTEKYLLVYSVEKREELLEYYAKRIAERLGLKIYCVTATALVKHKSIYDKTYMCATPELFISLVNNASFMVVSSFHGTAFSVNFQKDFITVTPNHYSSRISSLLKLCNLESRIISDGKQDITRIIQPIDYTDVKALLGKEREKAESFIKTNIQ